MAWTRKRGICCLRELENKMIALDHQLVRLHESNHQLQRVNGFIFSAITLEIVMLLFYQMER